MVDRLGMEVSPMCTAITYCTKDHYFGRNLDLEYSYQESITITPRAFSFPFRHVEELKRHHAMIGMAYIQQNYPLYYEATNEVGLSMAGLNFPESAVYRDIEPGKDNLAPFELIPWVLGRCANLQQARACLEKVNLIREPFSAQLPLSPLHWLVCSREGALVVEPRKEGLRLYENPVGVLTNEPPFPFHWANLNNYLNLTADVPDNRFSQNVELTRYSHGMGAMGLPGDLSSASRFVRAAFVKLNSVSGDGEEESVAQFFHILGSVAQQQGCVRLGEGKYERTVYSCCCNTDRGIYYYNTYENCGLTAVELHRENLDGNHLSAYPMKTKLYLVCQN